MRLTKAMLQLLDAQDVLLSRIKAVETSTIELSPLCNAWVNLEDRKRIMQGRPLPGVLRPQAGKGKRRSSNSDLLIDVVDQRLLEAGESVGDEPAVMSDDDDADID